MSCCNKNKILHINFMLKLSLLNCAKLANMGNDSQIGHMVSEKKTIMQLKSLCIEKVANQWSKKTQNLLEASGGMKNLSRIKVTNSWKAFVPH